VSKYKNDARLSEDKWGTEEYIDTIEFPLEEENNNNNNNNNNNDFNIKDERKEWWTSKKEDEKESGKKKVVVVAEEKVGKKVREEENASRTFFPMNEDESELFVVEQGPVSAVHEESAARQGASLSLKTSLQVPQFINYARCTGPRTSSFSHAAHASTSAGMAARTYYATSQIDRTPPSTFTPPRPTVDSQNLPAPTCHRDRSPQTSSSLEISPAGGMPQEVVVDEHSTTICQRLPSDVARTTTMPAPTPRLPPSFPTKLPPSLGPRK